jgi:hypothetical protein
MRSYPSSRFVRRRLAEPVKARHADGNARSFHYTRSSKDSLLCLRVGSYMGSCSRGCAHRARAVARGGGPRYRGHAGWTLSAPRSCTTQMSVSRCDSVAPSLLTRHLVDNTLVVSGASSARPHTRRIGEGGSIPFIGMLGQRLTATQFMNTASRTCSSRTRGAERARARPASSGPRVRAPSPDRTRAWARGSRRTAAENPCAPT